MGKPNTQLRLSHRTLSLNSEQGPTTYLLNRMAGFIVGEAATKVVFTSGPILSAGLKNTCRNRNTRGTAENEQNLPCRKIGTALFVQIPLMKNNKP